MKSLLKLAVVGIIIMAILAIPAYFLFFKESSLNKMASKNNNGRGNCGLTVNFPTDSQPIFLPLHVQVTVDHSSEATKDCVWRTAGNKAGYVTLVDYSAGHRQISSGILETINPDIDGPITYNAILPIDRRYYDLPKDVNNPIRRVQLIFNEEPIEGSASLNTFKIFLNLPN